MLSAFVLTVVLSQSVYDNPPIKRSTESWASYYRRNEAYVAYWREKAWDRSIAEGIEKERAGGVQRHVSNQPYVPPVKIPDTSGVEQAIRDQTYELRRMERLYQSYQPLYYDPRSYYVPYYRRPW